MIKLLKQYKESLKETTNKNFYGLNQLAKALEYTKQNPQQLYFMKIHDGSVLHKAKYFWVKNGIIWIMDAVGNPSYDMSKNPIKLSIVMSWFDKNRTERSSYTIYLSEKNNN